MEWWNVEPLVTLAQEVGCLGGGLRGRREESEKDTRDPSGSFAWDP